MRSLRHLVPCGLVAVAACAPAPSPPPPVALATSTVRVITPQVGQAQPLGIADVAGLEAHLEASGVPLDYDQDTQLEYFTAPVRVYHIGGGTDSLMAMTYESPAAALDAAARLAPDARSVVGLDGERIRIEWLGMPHVFVSGPLLVIYIGDDLAVRTALSTALGPQVAGA